MSTAKATAWKKAKRHTVTLPSGTVVDIELPHLAKLAKSGQMPNELVDAAMGQANSNEKVTRETIASQWDFYSYLVSITVVDPAITIEDVNDLPAEDVDHVVEFATRQRDLDAVGKHFAGLETQKSFQGPGSESSGSADSAGR